MFYVNLDGFVVKVCLIHRKYIFDFLRECRGSRDGEVEIDAVGEHDVQRSTFIFGNEGRNNSISEIVRVYHLEDASRQQVVGVIVYFGQLIVSLLEKVDAGRTSLLSLFS